MDYRMQECMELVILNFKGRKHLEFSLPSAVREAALAKGKCRVVVLDNGSGEDELKWIKSRFPSVDLVSAPGNDYLFSYNWYARQSSARFLIFLNNDLKLCEGFLAPLISHFTYHDVFSVSATSRDWDDTVFTFGPMQLEHHHGFWYWHPQIESQQLRHTLFTSGGFMAVDRNKFLEIGGFDRVYYPAYGEDLDLCFRAWKKGWRCLFEPRSVVLHRENGSWGNAKNSRSSFLQQRSSWIFSWKNLPRPCSRLEAHAYFFMALGKSIYKGNYVFVAAWVSAMLAVFCSSQTYKHSRTILKDIAFLQDRIDSPLDQTRI
jgi:GT2 family glycosyltransferase